MTKPYFTVAVIAHQPEPSLQKTLNSISGQTFPDFECLMIVEDSSGRSFEICKKMEYRDPRFRTVQLPESGSASASRNYAMAHAEGEYIAFLDGGDRFMPEMLERVYTANEKFRNLDIIQFTFQKVFQQPDGAFSAPQILSELPPEAMNRLLTGPEMTPSRSALRLLPPERLRLRRKLSALPLRRGPPVRLRSSVHPQIPHPALHSENLGKQMDFPDSGGLLSPAQQ